MKIKNGLKACGVTAAFLLALLGGAAPAMAAEPAPAVSYAAAGDPVVADISAPLEVAPQDGAVPQKDATTPAAASTPLDENTKKTVEISVGAILLIFAGVGVLVVLGLVAFRLIKKTQVI